MLCLDNSNVSAQDSIPSKRSGNGFLIAESAVGTGTLVGLATIWYDNNRIGFHGFNDSKEWLQMDKAGHLQTTYSIVKINSQILNWGGVEEKRAVKLATLQSLVYMTTVEVLDGFSPEYGASGGDLLANTIGSLAYYFQYQTNTVDWFTLKFSYKNSGLASYRPNLLGSNGWERWLKDYNGQTYWMSMSLQKLSRMDKVPGWLNLAVGYGASGLLGGLGNPSVNAKGEILPVLERKREWYLSFDINTDLLFPHKKTVNRAFRFVAFLKVPLPGIKYSKGEGLQWQWFAM